MEVHIVNEVSHSTVNADSINATIIGQKAKGLLSIPVPWRLPFLCVSSEVFDSYCKAKKPHDKQCIIKKVSEQLRVALPCIGIRSEDIIIRSSGVEEGMSDRGRYESTTSSLADVECAFEKLFFSLIQDCDPLQKMAFVVQKYIPGCALGHLSNERRFSQVKREWVYELTKGNEVVLSDRISVRYWRTSFNMPEEEYLTCSSQAEIPTVLRKVAWFYSKRKKAIHFEFIWDGSRVILVQADPETLDNDSLSDPMAPSVKVNSSSLSDLKVLREVEDEDKKYNKVKNKQLYEKIGLHTAPIYILNSDSVLSELRKGEISPLLEEDLKVLASNSAIVRLDIANVDTQQRQLLPRSNEIRDCEQLKAFLLEQKELLDNGGDIAFLLHVFIPARGAAFVNATPMGRIVEIEALWGLPEGLYYNAHDKIIVDTKSINPEIISTENVEILSKQAGYKEFYVAPNEKGQWVQKRTAQPYDWRLCIDDDSIVQIATESRMIANEVGKSISVMWFLGIDESYYKTRNLAWYHEEFTRGGYTSSEYKKKYFGEAEATIKDEESFQAFVNNPNIKEVTIRPVEDTLLRDKDFLKKVGEAAKKKGAAIVLEGAVLAHPLYQLCRTGARVLIPNQLSRYSDESYFNKLVRDKIPEIITKNGEEVICQKLTQSALLRALMEKAVEEALEIATASANSITEELGDEFEVVSSIIEIIKSVKTIDKHQQKRTIIVNNLVHDRILFQDKQRFFLTNKLTRKRIVVPELGTVELDISFESTKLQIELHMFHESNRSVELNGNKYIQLTDNPNTNRLFRLALSLTSYSRMRDVRASAYQMKEVLQKMVQAQSISEEEFMETVRKKREKRGGFAKGYILKSSSLSQDAEEINTQEQLELSAPEYSEVALLDYSAIKNADFLQKGNGELVLRISLPICFNEYQAVFKSNTVKKYIGEKRIVVGLTRNKDIITLRLLIQKDEEDYTQLMLPI